MLAAVIAAGAVLVAACSSVDDQVPTVAEVSTTTDPTAAADMVPPPAPLPAAQIVLGLETAQSSSDFCGLLEAMDVARPDPADRDGALDVYRTLVDTTKRASSFVPADLRLDWGKLTTGIKNGYDALRTAKGDLADPEVRAAFGTADMVEADETLERYQFTECV